MKGILPRANVGRFKLSGAQFKKFEGGQFKLDAFEKEYNAKEEASYLEGCFGDSGSGQWVTIDQGTDDERRALVAVLSQASVRTVEIMGKPVAAVCGSSLTFSSGEMLSRGPRSTITTHQNKLEFIKKWAEI